MRKYTLASQNARKSVDLRNYTDIITDAVHSVMPTATVQVEKDFYTVTQAPSQGDAVRIGRLICQSQLKQHCILIPKLFSSIEIGGKEQHGTKKHTGGHH